MKILLFIIVFVSSVLSVNGQTRDTPRLTGTIYDQQGAVIVGAKVIAKANGKVFEAVTNREGFYFLTLPFNPYEPGSRPTRYDITAESRGFLMSTIKAYIFVPAYTGRMSLDIALEVATTISDTEMITKTH